MIQSHGNSHTKKTSPEKASFIGFYNSSFDALQLNCSSSKMNKAALIMAAVFMTVTMIGCNSTENPDAGIAGAELIIQDADGMAVLVDDFAEIEESVPFEIAYPGGLPEGVRLKTVQLSMPPAAMVGGGRQRSVRVLLRYGDEADSFAFQLAESLAAAELVHPKLETIMVSLADGTTFEIHMFEDAQTRFIGAAWTGCGIGFVLSGASDDEFGPDWPPRIARSIVESCE